MTSGGTLLRTWISIILIIGIPFFVFGMLLYSLYKTSFSSFLTTTIFTTLIIVIGLITLPNFKFIDKPVYQCKTCGRKFKNPKQLGGHCAGHKKQEVKDLKSRKRR